VNQSPAPRVEGQPVGNEMSEFKQFMERMIAKLT
jgi:hypothetical protein